MATRTVVKEARALDHIYDQVHTTTGAADHNKLTMKALATQFEKVPNADSYFSELVHFPRAGYRPGRGKDNYMPKYIDPRWDPRLDHDAECNIVFGKERFKYDRRPIVKMGAFTSSAPQIVMYDMKGAGLGGQQTTKGAPGTFAGQSTLGRTQMEPLKKTVGTQSMYRESEAQTVPYTPDFIAKGAPEVLTLRNLTYENGLPASLFEVKIIERTRQKRLFEQMLPPATDEFCFTVRAQLLEAQEFKEWAERERQIVSLQEKRLEMVKALLKERDEKRKAGADAKIERLRQKKAIERDRVFAANAYKRIKVLRKMYTARQHALEHVHRGEKLGRTVAKYQNKASNVYAPLTRLGNIPPCNTAKIEIQPSDLKSYPKLVQLERTLPAQVLRAPEIDQETLLSAPSRKEAPFIAALDLAMKSIYAGQMVQGDLGGVAAGMGVADVRSPDAGMHQSPKSPKRKKGAAERAETPHLGETDALPEEEERAQALLLLQRVLRGRAYQNRMFEGKEKRLDLIEELRSSEQIMGQSTREEDVQAKQQMHEQLMKEDAEDALLGKVVSSTLDELSKELERMQEMRRIDAMVHLAERDRRMRQATEGGRRQAEERVRAREDEIFRQIMKDAHQGTVDSYLEEILTSTVEASAKQRAMAEAKAQASKLTEIVDRLEGAGDGEGCVKELVNNFMLPHAQREIISRRIEQESKRFIDAARDALDATMGQVETEMKEEQLEQGGA